MKGYSKAGAMLLATLVAGAAACSAGDSQSGTSTGSGAATLCVPNEQVTCACPAGAQGVQSCLADGSGFGPCNCDGTGGAGGASGPCGDNFCDQGDENCHTCPADCGSCAPCDEAPACPDPGGVMVPPADAEHFPELDVAGLTMRTPEELHQRLVEEIGRGTDAVRVIAAAFAEPERDEHPLVTEMRSVFAKHPDQAEAIRSELDRAGLSSPAVYRDAFPVPRQHAAPPEYEQRSDEFPGGTLECGRPFLRIGITRITVHDDQDGSLQGGDDEIYCVVQAEAQNGAELRITPLSPAIDDGSSWDLSLNTGVFWGQLEQTHPGSDLLVTYDCIENDNTQAYQNLLDAVADGAENIGGALGDDNGWIFTTGGAIASVASAAMGLNGEDHVFNFQQYVLLEQQLELTNGYYWSVRQNGSNCDSCDWELTVKAWGCAEFGLL